MAPRSRRRGTDMSAMKTIFELTDDPEELVIRLAEMAGIMRDVAAAGAAEPVLCLLDCDPHHFVSFGPNTACSNCATRVLPASQWHALLTIGLRYVVARR